MNPPGFLPHRIGQIGGEKAACGNQLAVGIAQPQKPAGAATTGDQHPQLIILGQAFRRKRANLALRPTDGTDMVEYGAPKAAADPRRRQTRLQGIAHHHRLGMQFGKLVAIMPGHPARA